MTITIDDFNLTEKQKNNINDWINSFNNDTIKKPLFIEGSIGCGKTELSKIILKDYTNIHINNYFTDNLVEYINDCLSKKDINMLFNLKKIYKSILFDNILSNDKNIIKEIKNILNNMHKYKKNPIIIISSDMINKNINLIKSKSLLINIKYDENSILNILNKIFNNKFSKNNLLKISSIYKDNINNIIVNKENIINNYYSNIDDNNKTSIELTENLKNNIEEDLFIKYSSEYNIISFNILDNIIYKYEYINKIIKIYNLIILSDIFIFIQNKNNYYDNIDLSIFYSIVYPYYYIKNTNNILNKKIKYNSYISKSVIFTHNNNLCDNYNNYYIIYDILIRLLYNNKINQFKEIYLKYNCKIKVLNIYIKLSNIIYNKEINKKIINKINNIVKI